MTKTLRPGRAAAVSQMLCLENTRRTDGKCARGRRLVFEEGVPHAIVPLSTGIAGVRVCVLGPGNCVAVLPPYAAGVATTVWRCVRLTDSLRLGISGEPLPCGTVLG